MSVKPILSSDTLSTGFRSRYNESINEIVVSAIDNGDGTITFNKFSGGSFTLNTISFLSAEYAYSKAQTDSAIEDSVTELRAGVAVEGDNLNKLYNLILSNPAVAVGGLKYMGVWDAINNNPPIPAAQEIYNGQYYKINIASQLPTENWPIDGIEDWKVGDWIICNGTSWDKIANYEAVTSVNNQTGTVIVTKFNIGLGNADNTSDANKPISNAQAVIFNMKVDKNGFRQVALANLELAVQNTLALVRIATTQEAEAGVIDDAIMSPFKVLASIQKYLSSTSVEALQTENKEIISAINEINAKSFGEGGSMTGEQILAALGITTLSGNNTGDQDLSGLQPKEAGKGLSTNDYTTTEKNKLAGINEHWRGTYQTLAALKLAIPTGVAGNEATIDAGVGTQPQKPIWDETDNDWYISSGTPITVDQSVNEGSSNAVSGGAVFGALGNKQSKINIAEGNIVIGGASNTLVDSGINIRMTLI